MKRTNSLAYDDIGPMLIDGQWRQAVAGERLPVLNPGTEKQIGWVSLARKPDLDAAVTAAVRGFSIWSRTAPLQRARVLAAAAALLRERNEIHRPTDVAGAGQAAGGSCTARSSVARKCATG